MSERSWHGVGARRAPVGMTLAIARAGFLLRCPELTPLVLSSLGVGLAALAPIASPLGAARLGGMHLALLARDPTRTNTAPRSIAGL